MRIAKISCFLIIFFASCQTCKVDKDFEQTFESKLSIISESVKKQKGLNGSAVRSVFYMEELTQIKSSAIIGDLSYYQNANDFHSDISKWRIWFSENKCSIGNDTSEKVLKNVIYRTKWMDNG